MMSCEAVLRGKSLALHTIENKDININNKDISKTKKYYFADEEKDKPKGKTEKGNR